MARKRSSLAEDIAVLVSRLPWPVGIALAVISYLWLHSIAAESPQAVQVNGVVDLGKTVQDGLWRGLATLGQYVLPILCLGGALASFLGRRKRERLLTLASGEQGRAAVAGMNWREFELLVGEYFRQQGYAVTESRPGPDGGIDVRLVRNGQPTLVQCKHWARRDVDVKVVRELYGVMASERASSGMIVASGGFTAEARNFAQRVGLELVDGESLRAKVRQVRHEPELEAPAAKLQSVSTAATSCPRCGGTMVARVAKRGASAGQRFLGCASYPRCTGTLSL